MMMKSLSTVVLAATLLLPALLSRAVEIAGIGGSYAVPVSSMKEVRNKTTIIQQTDFSCGSAAIATLLSHQYGFQVTEQVVFEEMYANGEQQKIRKEGFSLLDMKLFLERHGFQADGFEQPLDTLKEAKIPAIVLIKDRGYNHFVVIKGLKDDRVLIGDPARGTRSIPRSTFDAMWNSRLLFVIHNKTNMAKFNEAVDWRSAPPAPIVGSIGDQFRNVALPKFGPGDF
ncbi:C39 family peptidase [Undibacterium terreum]|nr:C39 family peptidase [Undibacterium terreum]